MVIGALIEGPIVVGLRVARISWLASCLFEGWICPTVTWMAGRLEYRSNVRRLAGGLVGRPTVRRRRESGSVGGMGGGLIVRMFVHQARGQERLSGWRSVPCLVVGRIGRTTRRLVGLVMSWRPGWWLVGGRSPDRLLVAAMVATFRLTWWGSVPAAR